MHDLTIFTNKGMKDHNPDIVHLECPKRLDVIMDMIVQDFPDVPVETSYPANEDLVLLAHPQSHLDSIIDQIPFEGFHQIDGDTFLSSNSYDAGLLSVGSTCQAVRAVLDGDTKTAFALSRPPGHHAEYNTAMGFCLFSNAFIGARYANMKTLIIDFDVHHGNGTEDLVKRHVANGRRDIAYASTHQSGIFPDTGMNDSTNICNCPLLAGAGSKEFRSAIIDKIVPFATIFEPVLIIFSAGFDGHESDNIADLNMCHDDFAWIVEQFAPICPRIVSVLEGGYNLETLPLSVKHHLKALADS